MSVVVLRAGDELPPRVVGPLTMEDVVRYQGAAGDLNPHHYDAALAREAGFDRFFSPGMLQASHMGAMVVDLWGANAIRRFRVRFHELVWVGDVFTCTARVAETREHHGEACLDVELACTLADGIVALTGVATVAVG